MEKNMISNREQLERIKIRIVKLRDILGLRSAAFAKKCGIDTSTMYRIEGRSRREYSVSERNLRKIAEAVNVDLNWLLGMSGEDDIPVFLQGKGDIGKTECDPAESQTSCADRLRQLRVKLGLSQRKFADQVGVSLSMLSAIEQGRIKLSIDFARRISQKCDGVTAEWLLYGEEYPVNDDLIEWLKNNREERIRIWEKSLGRGCENKQMINRTLYSQMGHVFCCSGGLLHRHMPKEGKHSLEAIELVKEFVAKLEDIKEGNSEMFPYTTIEKLKKEFIETVRDQNEPMEYGGDWY